MEKPYFVLTLQNEPFQVDFLKENDFAEKIEQKTGILSVSQEYYKSGRKINLQDITNDNINLVGVIDKQIPASRYFISTPSGQVRICIANSEQKTIKNLVFSFHMECKNKNLNYPVDEYSFYYNDEFLPYDYPLSQIPHDSIINLINQPAYPPVTQINITVSTLTGKSIQISLFENSLILDIKTEIQKLEGLPIDQQRLVFAGKQLEDEKLLNEYNIQDESKLYLVLNLRGGGPQVFSFNEMSNEIKLEFSQNAPEWRTVEPGISFIGICENRECVAYNREVISNAGLGVFDINRQAGMMPCPMCKQTLSNAKNCGFFMAEWKFFGIDSNGIERTGNGDAYEYNYTTFLDGDDVQWRVLRIAVRQRDNIF
ncbi:hypothetical protein SteCoe_38762 [Stentor coeruleus]|uniref:Ubiquitin-like domain-containing protein n=1 Tax=Stentor coeruleus TaxID=5963 RepID=A0A1R2AL56_9CILI|nr:hypothetical protein SteCoe_38762 [Stentor coeruleus]